MRAFKKDEPSRQGLKNHRAERPTQNAQCRMHCLLAVSLTFVCLRFAFNCRKGKHFIVFGLSNK